MTGCGTTSFGFGGVLTAVGMRAGAAAVAALLFGETTSNGNDRICAGLAGIGFLAVAGGSKNVFLDSAIRRIAFSTRGSDIFAVGSGSGCETISAFRAAPPFVGNE